eukprot:COSAG03_NODE_18257_length_358_cov_1.926641_1_plen_29_part_01
MVLGRVDLMHVVWVRERERERERRGGGGG